MVSFNKLISKPNTFSPFLDNLVKFSTRTKVLTPSQV